MSIDSPFTPSTHQEALNIDFNDRINSLHTSLLHQLEIIPKTSTSLEQIFDLLSVIFRFLRKNLQVHQKLSTEYTELSNRIEKLLSISAQYLHDRHEHENELFFLKDQISQILGEIGYTQESLEQYWTIIQCLESESERLQGLLSNPQLVHGSQRRFEILQETQKIKLDRLIEENEQIKQSIIQLNNSIEIIQRQIEIDLKELDQLKPIVQQMQLEHKDVDQQWLQIEQQTAHLRKIIQKSKRLENDQHERMKTFKIQFDFGRKQLDTLANIHHRTNQRLTAVETNENQIKQYIENTKAQIVQKQTQKLICRDHIHHLRQQAHELELTKRHTQHHIQSEEHTNVALERQRSMLENDRSKICHRVKNLTEQASKLVQKTQTNERILSMNTIAHDDQQSKIIALEITVKNLVDLNNHLEKLLQENRSIRRNEREKVYSIKQISFQKRKQLLTNRKRLHTLSIDQHQLVHQTIRNTFEILRFNNLLHQNHDNEKYLQMIFRKKKLEIMKREKQRASLNRLVHDHENEIDFLMKKNQFIENELENKIDHFQVLRERFLKQQHDRILTGNQKQRAINTYREKRHVIEEIQQKIDQLEKISANKIHRITKQTEENEQLKLNIHHIKQQIMCLIRRNQRQIDECALLNEKIELYTHLNDRCQQQEQCYVCNIREYSIRIENLQRENRRLNENIENCQTKAMIVISSHHQNRLKQNNLNRINQILSHRSVLIRTSSRDVHTHQSLEDYSFYVSRLMERIYQCIQWREKLVTINQLYWRKIEQIHQQKRLLSNHNEIAVRYKMNVEIKQCKAMRAESRLQTYI